MCISPISIRNPNYGCRNMPVYVDTTSSHIAVPCGVCGQCVAVRQMDFVQRTLMESTKNHLFFCTLTYNNEHLPVVTTSTGYDIPYASIRDVQLLVKRIRNNNLFGRSFRYFAVSELGTSRGRPHFHILWLLPKLDGDDYNTCLSLEHKLFNVVLSNWVTNVGSKRVPVYVPLCTYVRKFVRGRLCFNYDLHYVSESLTSNGFSNVAFYVSKYMLKPSNRAIRLQRALHLNLDSEEYDSVWNLVKPKCFKSLDFGLSKDSDVSSYVRKCVVNSSSQTGFASFFNPSDGSSYPLSRFYKKRPDIYSVDDELRFFPYRGFSDIPYSDGTKEDNIIRKFSRNQLKVESNDVFSNLFLFE